MKNFNGTIGNRTRGLPACSTIGKEITFIFTLSFACSWMYSRPLNMSLARASSYFLSRTILLRVFNWITDVTKPEFQGLDLIYVYLVQRK